MNIEVIEASISDKTVIRNMMELYNYDMSEFEDVDLDEHGLYGYKYLDNYWSEKDRYPFIIKVDEKLAGFILVNKYGIVQAEPIDYSIAEFFIMKKYRRRGVGKIAVFNVFNRFHGTCELKELAKNRSAHVFWRNVIGEYTSNNYQDINSISGIWDGPIQRFNNLLKNNKEN